MLEQLFAGALADSEARRERVSLHRLESLVLERCAPIDALAALAPAAQVKIIAEVKRASPSRGVLAEIASPQELACTYEAAGASAISVLTESRRFKGSLQDLEVVAKAVSVPVLRKDFISTRYQILEARAAGADLVLLIVAGLTQPVLEQLYGFVRELGMTALVEAHTADEIARAIDIGAQLMGVNARNLNTFELDRNLFGELADQIPAGVCRVAESAVKCAEDVHHYRAAGADVVLVGEALVLAEDPVQELARYVEADL